MGKDSFERSLVELDIDDNEFCRRTGVTPDELDAWKRSERFPPWVTSWLEGQRAIHELQQFRTAISRLMGD